jgi:hypothetical protein
MRALIGMALATVMAACTHAAPERAARRWNASCLVHRGCPKPVVTPAACSPDVAPLALTDVMQRADELDGAPIAVRGPLLRTGGMCTLLGCYSADSVETRPGGLVRSYRAPEPGQPHAMATLDDETFAGDRILLAEGGCCNHCGAALALGGLVWLSGPGLGCGGDESQICCGVDPRGQEVVARGILRHHSTVPTIEAATLCTPPAR